MTIVNEDHDIIKILDRWRIQRNNWSGRRTDPHQMLDFIEGIFTFLLLNRL